MAAAHLKKSCNKNLKPGLQTNDHMPKRRKRRYSQMSLMLLIFVSCCLTLIFRPLHVQAKESYNATSEGENMLSNDRQSHQHDKGEININADKTNDNGTFKRLQPSGSKIENAQTEEEEVEEEDEHSSEVIEMIQPPHTLRHQEHYKQRILLGEKHKQQQQQQEQHLDGNSNDDIEDGDNDDDGDDDVELQERELTQYNRNLRYKQIQQALREPIASPAPHHRRHEHHFDKQRLEKQTELAWPQQQHHLRHQHHQQQQQQQQHQTQEFPHHSQPQLRHLKHEMRKQNITGKKLKQPLPHQRYFDRESSYMNPMLDNKQTTEGPHLRHSGSNLHWKSIQYLNNPHNRLYNDEGSSSSSSSSSSNNNQKNEEDIKRFSLSLDGHDNEQENVETNNGKKALDENAGNDEDANYDANDSGNDYSYEDDNDDEDVNKEINKQNNYPSITSYTKTNVKRYTNPLKQVHQPSSSSTANSYRNQHAGHHLRHAPPPAHNMDVFKTNSNNNNNEENNDYDDIENIEDDTDEETFSSSDESSDTAANDDDDKMTNEKWNKIEHEHYRKQLQHQRAMQALRSRRPQNDNAPHTAAIKTNTNKYSSYTPSSAALSAASTYNGGWKKRQILNEDDSDNIYSRYYVPGSMTRKKEEELGSPTAILESRRQYALQQRQNKALASAHHRRIVTEGTCRWPQPRVERIRRDSWKIYTPHCTILHRCTDDAGCCPSERQTCAPKRTKNVDLYFFVISLNETQGSIEKLTFANHTECHCINRSKQRAPEYASSGAKDLMAVNNQIPYLRRATILNCYCPNLFEKILQEDGFCRCDCSSGNMGCDWLKRGMEHFSMNDRKCIIEGRCKLPTCEYGLYIKKHGRCPRREERHLSADGDW